MWFQFSNVVSYFNKFNKYVQNGIRVAISEMVDVTFKMSKKAISNLKQLFKFFLDISCSKAFHKISGTAKITQCFFSKIVD